MQNLDRTLLKVRWRAGGDCVIFQEDLNGNSSAVAATASLARLKASRAS